MLIPRSAATSDPFPRGSVQASARGGIPPAAPRVRRRRPGRATRGFSAARRPPLPPLHPERYSGWYL